MQLFLTVLWVSMQCVIVLFPDHTNVPFLSFNHVPEPTAKMKYILIELLLAALGV